MMGTRFGSWFTLSWANVLAQSAVCTSLVLVRSKMQKTSRLCCCAAAAEPRFVKLKDGRRIAYEEKGLAREEAEHTILVFHAFLACRTGGIPEVSTDLLKELGVRVVSIDRPGYGYSDPGPRDPIKALRSFPEEDLGQLIKTLELGRPHIVTVSQGSSFGYAAACYAPDAIGNIAMLCPTVCIHWEGVPENVKNKFLSSKGYSFMSSPRMPGFLRDFLVTRLLVGSDKRQMLKPNPDTMSRADMEAFSKPEVLEAFVEAMNEALVPPINGIGASHDMWQRGSRDWGFQLSHIAQRFRNKIHLWYGDEDPLNIPEFNRFVKTAIPDIVELHELKGEGHVSFLRDEKMHRAMLASLLSCS